MFWGGSKLTDNFLHVVLYLSLMWMIPEDTLASDVNSEPQADRHAYVGGTKARADHLDINHKTVVYTRVHKRPPVQKKPKTTPHKKATNNKKTLTGVNQRGVTLINAIDPTGGWYGSSVGAKAIICSGLDGSSTPAHP